MKGTPVQQAIAAIMGELQKFQARGLTESGGGGMKVEIEAGGDGGEAAPAMCEACAAGTCDDPEHMSETDSTEMDGLYS